MYMHLSYEKHSPQITFYTKNREAEIEESKCSLHINIQNTGNHHRIKPIKVMLMRYPVKVTGYSKIALMELAATICGDGTIINDAKRAFEKITV